MTRFLLALFATVALVLIILSIIFFKDSYRILPISGSDPRLMSQFADWQDFKAPKGAFEASFPTIPQHAAQTVRDPKTGQARNYDMYVAEKSNGTIFMVSLIEFPGYTGSLEDLKKTVINDLLVSNPQNQLKSMTVGIYKLFPTIDFVITNRITTINGRIFSDGNVIYLLSGIFSNAFFNQEEYDHFINSFEWMLPK